MTTRQLAPEDANALREFAAEVQYGKVTPQRVAFVLRCIARMVSATVGEPPNPEVRLTSVVPGMNPVL